ncbi:hypothetical protein BJF86_13220 [Serinicoccus sp. CNJ-927]|uniref:amino acid kinase family protein n=1 Tax=Serinicoccus sp. CNJ-927 TaxID=1904970 RepID=UPI00095B3DC8|nr:hypothetical protein [Serinicoccus sp. CNJ-927]OLT43915.1 hypothetical protein BJF86_13220 [Serinicoccus sp. CNJ-927]
MNRRTLIVKLSGAALGGLHVFHPPAFRAMAAQVKQLRDSGHRVGLVLGGGNAYRASESWECGDYGDLPRTERDNLGMLATAMNAQAMTYALRQIGLPARMIARQGIAAPLAEPWDEQDLATTSDVIVVAGGTGQSGVSSDVAAPLLAAAMGAREIVVAKHNINGVFTSDPNVDHPGRPAAQFLAELTAQDALDQGLQVMDREALVLCQQAGCTVRVVSANDHDAITRVAGGEAVGSTIWPDALPLFTEMRAV